MTNNAPQELVSLKNKLDDSNIDFSPLTQPLFSILDLQKVIKGITYRKINDWDSHDLISSFRVNKKAGWRRFSIEDAVRLCIIHDLKYFAFDSESIGLIIAKIMTEMLVDIEDGKKQEDCKRYNAFKYLIFYNLAGNKTMITIRNRIEIDFYTEASFLRDYFFIKNASEPVIILPFHAYISRIAPLLKMSIQHTKDSTISSFIENSIQEREKEILKIVSNQTYREIVITKSDSDTITVRTKSRKKGPFTNRDIIEAIKQKQYQKIELSRVDGSVLNLSREETFKL